LFCSAVALLLAISTAGANDSTAELENHGLVLVKNDKIQMRSEELSISAEQIRVRYRYFNISDRDEKVLVAFPLPDVDREHGESDISMPTNFATLVNSKPVTAKTEQKIFAKGVDRTDVLRGLNIPLEPHVQGTGDALDALPQERWGALIEAGIARTEEYDAGKGMRKHLAPAWTLKTTYYWEQVFPAKAETLIEHRYQPSVGGTAGTSLGDADSLKSEWFAEYQKKYCMDAQFLAAIDRAAKAAKGRGEGAIPYVEQRIDYVLKTGANWAGPIKDFRLTVSKGDADSLISFCGEGVKKISATEFEMRKTDFTPRQDLHFLILKKFGG
jgi:hypothetical protein